MACLFGMSFFGCSGGLKEVAVSSKTDEKIHLAALSGNSAGFAVGYAGTVQYTEDGGKTWTSGANSSMCQFALYSIDDQTCFSAGNGSHVIKTTNGGKTWTHLANIPGARAKGISFANMKDGWVWTKNALFSTRNGGGNWQTVTLPPDCTIIESGFLQSSGNGFLCGLDGYVYRTRDNGRTWERTIKYLDTKDKTFKAVLAGGVQGTAIRLNGKQGLIALIGLKDGKSAVKVLRTNDGAETWSEPNYYFVKTPSRAVTISPEMQIALFNSDTTVSMYTVK